MPFTPFHMGPGLLLKALLQGSFSLLVFGWTQIAMDLQPLIVLLSGNGHLHGFTHTYLGAGLIAVAAGLSGKYLAEYGLRLLGLRRYLPIGWTIAILSAVIGAFSHVLLDSLMHADMQPLAPLSSNNPFLGCLSIDGIYDLCLYGGLLGAALYGAIAHLSKRCADAAQPVERD